MEISNPQSLLDRDLDQGLVALYRGWDALEQSESGNTIIDFDLAPQRPFRKLSSRKSCLAQLRGFYDELKKIDGPFCALIRQRLLASITYLEALLGEQIEFETYIQQTLGLTPRFFRKEEIAEREERAVAGLRKFGLSFDRRDLKRFQAIFRGAFGIDRKDLPSQFELFRVKWVEALRRHTATALDRYEIQVGFAIEDAYWKSWISGDLSQHRIQLRINIHPRHHWYQGSVETLVIHEYCAHGVQIANWHKRLEKKLLPEFLGILTVHFPDQFLLEGLAESLVYFLPNERTRLEPLSITQRDFHYYVLSVMNNVHILANEKSREEAFEYANRHLRLTEKDVLWREIRDRTLNPLYRCYQYVYGFAKEEFLRLLTPLDSDQMWSVLNRIYSSPMTRDQFREIVRMTPRVNTGSVPPRRSQVSL